MTNQLTVEFAETVPLALNPFKRHQQVADILQDPIMVGEDTEILVNPGSFRAEQGVTIAINTLSPILGRRTLKKAATSIEWIHNQGENNGEDF